MFGPRGHIVGRPCDLRKRKATSRRIVATNRPKPDADDGAGRLRGRLARAWSDARGRLSPRRSVAFAAAGCIGASASASLYFTDSAQVSVSVFNGTVTCAFLGTMTWPGSHSNTHARRARFLR